MSYEQQMHNLNAFETKERVLTNNLFINNKCITNLEFTPPNSYARYDGTFLMNNVPCMFEVKVRNFPYTKYNSWILQLDKYKGLIQYANTHALLYINYFTTNEPDVYSAIIFNISKRYKQWGNNPPVETMTMNDATFKSTTNKVDKTVIMLNFDKSFGDALSPKFSINGKKINSLF